MTRRAVAVAAKAGSRHVDPDHSPLGCTVPKFGSGGTRGHPAAQCKRPLPAKAGAKGGNKLIARKCRYL